MPSFLFNCYVILRNRFNLSFLYALTVIAMLCCVGLNVFIFINTSASDKLNICGLTMKKQYNRQRIRFILEFSQTIIVENRFNIDRSVRPTIYN